LGGWLAAKTKGEWSSFLQRGGDEGCRVIPSGGGVRWPPFPNSRSARRETALEATYAHVRGELNPLDTQAPCTEKSGHGLKSLSRKLEETSQGNSVNKGKLSLFPNSAKGRTSCARMWLRKIEVKALGRKFGQIRKRLGKVGKGKQKKSPTAGGAMSKKSISLQERLGKEGGEKTAPSQQGRRRGTKSSIKEGGSP